MGYAARILKDSISTADCRLTTFEVTFPRIVLAEFNTHRALSRNSASSRAIPVEKRIAMVEGDPFIPQAFGKNQKGMQAAEALEGEKRDESEATWRAAAKSAVWHARELAKLGVHKQLANRLLEPFLWHTVIASATEWSNFFALRCHPDAQPEIRTAAEMMRDLYRASRPERLTMGEWHRPLLEDERDLRARGYDADMLNCVSIGRCARVSYLTHDGRLDPSADLALTQRLMESRHLSPFEHVAAAANMSPDDGLENQFWGNFRGWRQYRYGIPNEEDFSRVVEAVSR